MWSEQKQNFSTFNPFLFPSYSIKFMDCLFVFPLKSLVFILLLSRHGMDIMVINDGHNCIRSITFIVQLV